ncbi:MAG: putative pre-16S rRNA nuclease [Candidatus Anoxychlamydiales bacterium]|uniref:YqgF/RNase H-like domain-containing protein n=1 Tax=marine sediment metagenome TaxID=412755 RepID=A0A0F9KML4_9ZZZZ|nr:putative pre-16S rRNA nuclease [Candidatus Anoxychlamydiales bacterium]HEU64914.1 Holliday junction resolvase RuvX [Chlamydiota bacterium]
MRIVAIDYGKVRIGLAITDMSKTIAYPFKTVQASTNFEKTSQAILDALKEHIDEIEKIIIGLPLLLEGGFSEMTTEVNEFVKVFKTKTTIPIELIDERLSSVQAERHLKDNLKLNRKKRSKKIDPMAAALLLQNFLNFN